MSTKDVFFRSGKGIDYQGPKLKFPEVEGGIRQVIVIGQNETHKYVGKKWEEVLAVFLTDTQAALKLAAKNDDKDIPLIGEVFLAEDNQGVARMFKARWDDSD